MAEELFLKVKEFLCKQDVEKLKLFAATLAIDGEQIKASKGRRDLSTLQRGIMKQHKLIRKNMGRRMLQLMLITMLIIMVKIIIFRPHYVS